MKYLPEDMIVDILFLLPLKSLLRFKCVSKRWRSFISSKPFIETRLKHSITDPDLSHHHLIMNHRLYRLSVWLCSLRCAFDEPAQDDYQRLRLIYDEQNGYGSCEHKILGSCNGLILIAVDKANLLVIWNPATRKANTILPSPIQKVEFPYRDKYSMGYDESTDDYKVVRTYLEDRRTSCTETHIYNSRTCSWKKIESSRYAISSYSYYPGAFVNGRLHWLPYEGNQIVCLDLVGEEEKYEIMGGPEYLSIHDGSEPVLKDLGGYLSLICLTSTSEINVSVMMKYGDHRSWTNILTLVDFDQNPTMETNIPRAMPL